MKEAGRKCPCEDHEPHEEPGPLEAGYCMYEYGHVIHLTREGGSSGGFWRRATTWCNRSVDEEEDAVEIYPGEPDLTERSFSSYVLCRSCLKAKQREEE